MRNSFETVILKSAGLLIAALCLAMLSGCEQPPFDKAESQPLSKEEWTQRAPNGRLNTNILPTAYRVDLRVDPRETTFGGTVEIDLDVQEKRADGLWLHGKNLEVHSVEIRAGGETREATWIDVLDSGVARVEWKNGLMADTATLVIDYTAKFDVNLAGLFRVDEQGKAYALAKSESIQARRFLPSYDEPGYKAPFTFTLTIPEGMHAIANTPETARTPIKGGFERVSFAPTRPLSTYLLSLAVGEFDKVERPDIPPNSVRSVPIPLTGYARAGKGAELDFILDVTAEMVRVFEEDLQQPYPYKKLDIVAAPAWPSGATELAGAITYRESRILVNEQTGPALKRSALEVHAHEIAHMWFGNLVTPPWWDDLWLKEGFATWGTPMALTQMYPDGGHDVEAVAAAISAMGLDSLAAARAVREPIDRNEDIRNAYDAITYRKGLAVIAMIDSYFGAETFRPALGRYIAAYEDSAADSGQFFEVIGETTGEPLLNKAFESFVQQSGLPLLDVEASCKVDQTELTLIQSRYRPLGSMIEDDRTWTIPVCVSWAASESEGRQCEMLDGPSMTFTVKDAPCEARIMPNAGGAGYYRFNVSDEGWATLIDALPDMPAVEALSALDSAIAAYEAGKVEPKVAVEAIEQALSHPARRVVQTAMNEYGVIIARLPEGGLAEANARQRAGRTIAAARDALLKRPKAEQVPELLDRMQAFEALTAKVPEERLRLLSAAAGFLSGDRSALTSDAYGAALAIVVEDGDAARFDTLLNSRTEIDDPAYEQAFASAIGRAKLPERAKVVRAFIASGELGPRETYALAAGQMSRETTRAEMWDALNADFAGFLENIPRQWRRRTPRLASGFCDTASIPEVQALFERHAADVPGYERALAETVESIELCAALQAETGGALEAEFAEGE